MNTARSGWWRRRAALLLILFFGGCTPRPTVQQPQTPEPVLAWEPVVVAERPEATPSPPDAASPRRVARAQRLLKALGFDPGPVDGIEGARTAAAIRAFQSAEGRPPTGRVDQALVAELAAARRADQVRVAQQALAAHGFDPGPIDGVAGPQTRAAVQRFQMQAALSPDGRVTDALLDALGVIPAAGPSTALGAAVQRAAVERAAGSGERGQGAETDPPAGGATWVRETAGKSPPTVKLDLGRADPGPAAGAPSRVLRPGDRLLYDAGKPRELQIDESGRLTLPEGATVQAAGLSVAELEQAIAAAMLERYLQRLTLEVRAAQTSESTRVPP